MTVQVNRHFVEVARETQKELREDLVRAVERAFPERATQAAELVETATGWMARNIPTVHSAE